MPYLPDGTYEPTPEEAAQLRATSQYYQQHPELNTGGATAQDRRTMTDPRVAVQYDEQGRPYTISLTGERNYTNTNATDKGNTFAHAYNWNPLTGEYDSHLNGSGALGLAEGALAVAGPALIGPSLAGGGAAAAGGGTTASASGGALPSSSIAGLSTAVPGAAAPGVVSGAGGNMGLLGTIGSFLKDPKNILDVLGDVGNVTSNAAKGSANQRAVEGNQALGYGNQALSGARDKYASDLAGANSQFTADLSGANYQREGQDRARKAALLSALLGGVQDAKITPGNPAIAARMPTMTGGARPSALAGGRDQLLALLSQGDPNAPTYAAPTPYQAPNLPTMPQAGVGEDILGGIGLGSSLIGAFQPKRQLQ